MLVLVADLASLATVDRDADHYTLVGGASIYPFAWSILLAARHEGLAGVMTTMVVREEATVRELLGVPETAIVAGVLALGRPVHQPTRLTPRHRSSLRHRRPVRRTPAGTAMRVGRIRSRTAGGSAGEGAHRGGDGPRPGRRRRRSSPAWSTTSTSSVSTRSGCRRS